jgi:probable addiction module antidote protein
MKRNENYKADLLEELRNDAEYAAEYLTAARADSNEAFLVALRDVAEARKGMKRVAREAKVNRENLYRALSRGGNPRIETVNSVLDVLGIEAVYRPKVAPLASGTVPLTAVLAGPATGPIGLTLDKAGGHKYETVTTTLDFSDYQLVANPPILTCLLDAARASEQMEMGG